MGEENRVVNFGSQARVNHSPSQPQQIQVDLKNAIPKTCQNMISDGPNEFGPREHPCGSELFTQAIKLYTISALLSPTGQELLAQQPVLICNKCGEVVS